MTSTYKKYRTVYLLMKEWLLCNCRVKRARSALCKTKICDYQAEAIRTRGKIPVSCMKLNEASSSWCKACRVRLELDAKYRALCAESQETWKKMKAQYPEEVL